MDLHSSKRASNSVQIGAKKPRQEAGTPVAPALASAGQIMSTITPLFGLSAFPFPSGNFAARSPRERKEMEWVIDFSVFTLYLYSIASDLPT